MSEAVKRYCMRAFGSIVQPIEVPYSGTWVPSADHDRIVASLQAQIERAVSATNAECNDWAREYELRMKVTAERNTLRAEVERLKEHEPRFEDVERLVKTLSFLGVSTPESMETACIRWLSLVRTLIRTAEDSKMLRQDSERQAEAKRIRILLIEAVVELKELKESVGYRAHTIGVIQRIDAALEASR